MTSMTSVGIREFRTNLHKYTTEKTTPIAITSHGRLVGYYIPARASAEQADFEALRRANQMLSAMLADNAMTEDDAVAAFDRLRKQGRDDAGR